MLKSHYIFVNIYSYSFEEPVFNNEKPVCRPKKVLQDLIQK